MIKFMILGFFIYILCFFKVELWLEVYTKLG